MEGTTLAEPARESAADTVPGYAPPGEPDLRASGWADVRTAAIATILAGGEAVNMLACDPDDSKAKRLAGNILAAIEDMGTIARRCVVNDAVLETVRKRAYAEGVADCKAARCRLAAVPDA